MNLSPEDLNPEFCPQHPTSIYIYEVTTAPMVYGDTFPPT